MTDPRQNPDYQSSLQKVQKELYRLRVQLISKQNFMGMMYLLTEFVDSPHINAPAMTDGLVVYYQPQLVEKMFMNNEVQDGVRLLFDHELLHCMLEHCWRLRHHDPLLRNMACDIVVNGIIEKQRGALGMPDHAFMRRDLQELSCEEVYDILLSESKHDPKTIQEQKERFERNRQGDLMEAQTLDQNGDPQENSPSEKGEAAGPASDELAAIEPTDGPGVPDKANGEGDRQGKPSLSQRQTHVGRLSREQKENFERQAKDTWRIRTEQATQALIAAGSGMGSHPLGQHLDYRFRENPQLNWRDLLWDHLTLEQNDYGDFNLFMLESGLFEEKMESHKLVVHVCVDSSGSIRTDDLSLFMTEVKAILSLYEHLEMQLYFADSDLYGPFPVASVQDLPPPKGGGGTSFVPFFKKMRQLEQQGDQEKMLLLYFTDGEGVFPRSQDRPDDAHCIWLIQKGGAREESFPAQDTKVRFVQS